MIEREQAPALGKIHEFLSLCHAYVYSCLECTSERNSEQVLLSLLKMLSDNPAVTLEPDHFFRNIRHIS